MSTWTADEAARELLSVLPLLNRLMITELRREAEDDMTMPQFRVLGYLDEKPTTLSAIARFRRVSLQAAGELVQSLVGRGWIERTPDPNDRRQSLLHLTEQGLQQYRQLNERMSQRLVTYLEKLSKSEMAAVQLALPALHRVIMEGNEDVGD